MKKLEVLRVNSNRISDLISIEKHPNYIKIDNSDKICFNISYQRKPSKKELRQANKLRHIEGTNVYLKEEQIKQKTLKTTYNSLKQQVNAATNQICSNQIQFTSSVVRFFQQLKQFE
ncbi:Leucine-rich_repeat [Hexamita inflata]|uniref:Leucine-rich repeat n=1 Tax=Hexamita inflata TaxID=28002 RepID=A0AA86P0Z5_9EUKA|nr:Leucine-rich repeat [Hexamita inflata]